jgi:hypothetical protein
MKQLNLFQENLEPRKLYKSKNSGSIYIIRSQTGTVCVCESYPRSHVEEVCDITYLALFNELEEIQ